MNSDRRLKLNALIMKQGGKCHYCGCQMCGNTGTPTQATLEHLVDKWSSPKHQKIESDENLVAACFQCNNTRGNERNVVARRFYKDCAAKRGVKIAVQSTSSSTLYKMFGPVPQDLFANLGVGR